MATQVAPGDPLRIRAQDWNDCVKAAELVRSLQSGMGARGGQEIAGRGTVLYKAHADLPRFSVVQLTGTALDVTDETARETLCMTGTTPSSTYPTNTAITQEYAASGDIVPAMIAGVSLVKVQMNTTGDKWCSIIASDCTKMNSGKAGEFRVLWSETGTGEKWAVVKLPGETLPRQNSMAITQASHGFTEGQAVYWTGAAYALAKADVITTSAYAGMVAAPSTDAFTLVIDGWASYPGGPGTAGLPVYLSASTAGAVTTTGAGTWTQMGVAISGTGILLHAHSTLLRSRVLGDTTNGAGTLKVFWAAGKYVEIDASGNVKLYADDTHQVVIDANMKAIFTYPNSNTVTIDSADFVGSSKAVKLRELAVCDSAGAAKTILALCSDKY